MSQVFKLIRFVRPYRRQSLISLALLLVVVVLDLVILLR